MCLKSVMPLLPPKPVSLRNISSINAYVSAWVMIEKYTPRMRERKARKPNTRASSEGTSNAAAQANVRASIPGMEAYNADHGFYTSATSAILQASYDQGIKNIRVKTATATTYCVDSTVGASVYKKAGPGAAITVGACP